MTNEQLDLIKSAFPNWPKHQGILINPPGLALIEEIERIKAVTLEYKWERSVRLKEHGLEIYLTDLKESKLLDRLQSAEELMSNITLRTNGDQNQITILRADNTVSFAQLLSSALNHKIDINWLAWLVSSDFSQAKLDQKIQDLHSQLEADLGGSYKTYCLIVEGTSNA